MIAEPVWPDPMTVDGTFETCAPILRMSVHRIKPEVIGGRSNDANDPLQKWGRRSATSYVEHRSNMNVINISAKKSEP
jgi:hypothetical protein